MPDQPACFVSPRRRAGVDAAILWSAAIIAVVGVSVIVWLTIRAAEQGSRQADIEAGMLRAKSMLESIIYPATQEWRAEVRRDTDGDGLGEYASIGDMLDSGHLTRDRWEFQAGVHVYRNFMYQVMLSSITDVNEQKLIVVAYPVEKGGMQPLVMDGSGTVYVAPKTYHPGKDAPDFANWPTW